MTEGQFYVYELIDPRDGSVFYVGKGRGRRILAHEVEARRGVHSRKCNRIRDIWAAGGSVHQMVVSRHADENEALQAEHDRIAKYGLCNLTNVLPGGAIGVEAYLARQAETERRRVDESRRLLAVGFNALAPKFARMFRAKYATGGFGIQTGDGWVEFGGALEKLFWDMVKATGWAEAKAAMNKHGVLLTEVSDGSPQSQA